MEACQMKNILINSEPHRRRQQCNYSEQQHCDRITVTICLNVFLSGFTHTGFPWLFHHSKPHFHDQKCCEISVVSTLNDTYEWETMTLKKKKIQGGSQSAALILILWKKMFFKLSIFRPTISKTCLMTAKSWRIICMTTFDDATLFNMVNVK